MPWIKQSYKKPQVWYPPESSWNHSLSKWEGHYHPHAQYSPREYRLQGHIYLVTRTSKIPIDPNSAFFSQQQQQHCRQCVISERVTDCLHWCDHVVAPLWSLPDHTLVSGFCLGLPSSLSVRRCYACLVEDVWWLMTCCWGADAGVCMMCRLFDDDQRHVSVSMSLCVRSSSTEWWSGCADWWVVLWWSGRGDDQLRATNWVHGVVSQTRQVTLHQPVNTACCLQTLIEQVYSRTLRSPAFPLLVQPFTRTDFSRRAFLFVVPSVWKSLPQTALISDSVFKFRP